MNLSGSGFFSNETAEMKALRKLYKSRGSSYDKHDYYIFMLRQAKVDGEPDPEDASRGDMPRGKQFGYVFNTKDISTQSLAWLIAHELGHGMFTLEHTFHINYSGREHKSRTSNLMDYAGGIDLAAFQWNIIANPAPLT